MYEPKKKREDSDKEKFSYCTMNDTHIGGEVYHKECKRIIELKKGIVSKKEEMFLV